MKIFSRKSKDNKQNKELLGSYGEKKNNMKIAAYGFEKIGFQIPDGHIMETKKEKIFFLHIDSEEALDSFTGVILPSGILESFKDQSTWEGRYVDVYCNRDTLLQKEREIINLVAYSAPFRPPIPEQIGHPFRLIPATHSGAFRPL